MPFASTFGLPTTGCSRRGPTLYSTPCSVPVSQLPATLDPAAAAHFHPRSDAYTVTTEDPVVDRLALELKKRHGATDQELRVVRSPLRICPLGAHIDHQLGTVTAMAIDRAVHLGYLASPDPTVRVSSLAFSGEVRFRLDRVPPPTRGDWGNYARGAAQALSPMGLTRGILGVTEGVHGEGGLSSSAAVGVAYLLALEEANSITVSREENVEFDRRIENGYLGLKNGILDQAAILHSRRDHLTRIECRTGVCEAVARDPDMPPFAILVAFSGVRQALTATGYNERVAECAEAARILLEAAGRPDEDPLLGNVPPEDYARFEARLEGGPARRARHFFTESRRVQTGLSAWKAGDLAAFGRAVTESGHSSIVNYECGSEPLIDLYEILCSQSGVHGARFSGAGFRGCCIALVDPEQAEAIRDRVASAYARKQPKLAKDAPVFICRSDDGARFVDLESPNGTAHE